MPPCALANGVLRPRARASILRKYEITQKLGKGAYAVVFKGVEKKSKEVVAIKKIFVPCVPELDGRAAQRSARSRTS